jgi:tRNA-specific 2-thiouridylase
MSTHLVAQDAAWTGAAPPVGAVLSAKTRYRQTDAACTVTTSDGRRFELAFEAPQWAATPGQSAVMYDGEVCLGGGVIEATEFVVNVVASAS